ncbi:MAG: hypothetical protein ACRYFX_10055 [Janthinobacterium lividum]
MDDNKIAAAILRSLSIKRDNKRAEMEALSQPVLDRTASLDYRKFQVEVEYWQLKNVVDDILANYPDLAPRTESEAAQNSATAPQ